MLRHACSALTHFSLCFLSPSLPPSLSLVRIVDYFVARYDSLSRSDVLVAQVEIAAEDAVFADLHAVILAYYRIVHAASDAALSAKMADAASITPRDLGIRSKFCLLPQAEEELEPSQTPPPYEKAIRTLSLITADTTPSAKATRIARVSQQIVECVNEYWSLRGMDTSSEAMAVCAPRR